MNRDFDEELGRSRQDGRRRETGSPDSRAEHSGGRRGETGSGAYSRRHSSHRAGYGTAGADYRSEQELWEERKRRQLHQEEAGESEAFSGRTERSFGSEERTGRGRSRAATSRGRGARPETGRAQSSQTRYSARQTAAGADGLSPRVQAQIQKKKRRCRLIIMIAAECIALALIFGYGFVARTMAKIQRPENFNMDSIATNEISEDVAEQMKGYWTIAVFGVDSRNNSVGKGNNADVIIICNIDQGSGEIKLVSVFRDTYLSVSDNGLYNKINQAYFLGGPKQAVEALNRNLDLQIDDFATFNWKAVVDAVNILGGVDVELSKAEFYYINAYITETVEATGVGSYQLKQAGLNHLDGVQAVAYARLRKMDTDFARTERQREIIDLCFQKLKKSDFAVVNNVMEAVFPQILSSVTIDDIIPAAKNLTKYTIADTMGFPAARSDANMGKKGACVIPQTLESNVTLLHQFLFGDENYQPSDMVKKISAKISADTGMYNEGKPIDHVGTDGGYIPKPTQATEATEETKENESESSTSETDESIIDGETDLEIETDEFGNEVDPPEDDNGIFGRPGESSGSGTVHPGRPGESSSGSMFPGAETSEGDRTTGPGAITYPGQDPTRGTSAAYPGATRGTTAAYPGSQGTSAAYPGSTKGSTAAYPGASSDEYVPEGPGSVIIGPGN